MARVDKTDSAVGVVRAILNTSWTDDELADEAPFGVGLNATGLIVKGAGQTGIIGVCIPNPNQMNQYAGQPADIFVLADIVELADLDPGKAVYAHNTTGVLSHTATAGTYVGFTVEEDRLILNLAGGVAGEDVLTGSPFTLPIAAVDPATTMALVNAIRAGLIARGIAVAA